MITATPKGGPFGEPMPTPNTKRFTCSNCDEPLSQHSLDLCDACFEAEVNKPAIAAPDVKQESTPPSLPSAWHSEINWPYPPPAPLIINVTPLSFQPKSRMLSAADVPDVQPHPDQDLTEAELLRKCAGLRRERDDALAAWLQKAKDADLLAELMTERGEAVTRLVHYTIRVENKANSAIEAGRAHKATIRSLNVQLEDQRAKNRRLGLRRDNLVRTVENQAKEIAGLRTEIAELRAEKK